MKIYLVTVLVLTFAILLLPATTTAQTSKGTPSGCPGKNGLTSAEITEMLQAHNAARAENKLGALTWDCKLADFAQEWATRGKFEHRTGPSYGESIFVASTAKAKAVSAVKQWMLEKASWNAATATCAAGKVCTHYTQVVWKNTTNIGCGINRAASGKWQVLLVCNYDPAGNSGGAPF